MERPHPPSAGNLPFAGFGFDCEEEAEPIMITTTAAAEMIPTLPPAAPPPSGLPLGSELPPLATSMGVEQRPAVDSFVASFGAESSGGERPSSSTAREETTSAAASVAGVAKESNGKKKDPSQQAQDMKSKIERNNAAVEVMNKKKVDQIAGAQSLEQQKQDARDPDDKQRILKAERLGQITREEEPHHKTADRKARPVTTTTTTATPSMMWTGACWAWLWTRSIVWRTRTL